MLHYVIPVLSPITRILNWLDFNKVNYPLINFYIIKAIVFVIFGCG